MDKELSAPCEHEELTFGSGDYYIFCSACGTSWIRHVQRTQQNNNLKYNKDFRVKVDER